MVPIVGSVLAAIGTESGAMISIVGSVFADLHVLPIWSRSQEKGIIKVTKKKRMFQIYFYWSDMRSEELIFDLSINQILVNFG